MGSGSLEHAGEITGEPPLELRRIILFILLFAVVILGTAAGVILSTRPAVIPQPCTSCTGGCLCPKMDNGKCFCPR